jgi:hypothetical protein
MGVDGIGSGGGRPVRDVGASEPAGARAVAAESSREAAGAKGAAPLPASPALEQLQRGDIDLDRYLDARVAEAVKHLDGKLPVGQLDFVRQALREQLATDPVLVELVREATGSVPTPSLE